MRKANSIVGFVISLVVLAACSAPSDSAPQPALVSTYSGSVLEFEGEGVLVVAVWADWAPVWKLLAPEVQKYQQGSPDGAQFQYLGADENRELVRSLGVEIVPSVVLIKKGRVVSVLPNLTSAEQLASETSKWLVG